MPHFRNFHGAGFDFAPSEPTEAENEKGLLVDFEIIGAQYEEDDTFVFIDHGGAGLPDDAGDAPTPTDPPAPETTPVVEDDLIIGASEEPIADDMFLF